MTWPFYNNVIPITTTWPYCYVIRHIVLSPCLTADVAFSACIKLSLLGSLLPQTWLLLSLTVQRFQVVTCLHLFLTKISWRTCCLSRIFTSHQKLESPSLRLPLLNQEPRNMRNTTFSIGDTILSLENTLTMMLWLGSGPVWTVYLPVMAMVQGVSPIISYGHSSISQQHNHMYDTLLWSSPHMISKVHFRETQQRRRPKQPDW